VSVPASDSPAPAAFRPARGGLLGLVQRIAAEPMGLLGLCLVLLLIFTGLFADWLTPYDPIKINVKERLADPSWTHVFGTDYLGRDVFARVIKGSSIALVVAASTTALSVLGGLTLGLLAGYGPRWLDNCLLLLFDTVYSFPSIMLQLAVITLLGPSLGTVVLVIVIATIPAYARLVRTSTLSVKSSEFILAERSMGAGLPRITIRHLLPNVVGPLLIIASMDVPVVIAIEAGLSFLGLGVRPPAPSWGNILADGFSFIREAPWIVIGGGIPLILASLGFTFLGEALRDQLDPKLRRDR
jgi:peptide/nickel transport system permease protein